MQTQSHAGPGTLFALTWPLFIDLALHFLTGALNTFMVGHVSYQGVAALAVGNQVFDLAITLFSVDDSLLLEELESLLDRRLPQQWFPGFEPDLTRSAPAPRRHGKAAEKQRAKKRAFGGKGKR